LIEHWILGKMQSGFAEFAIDTMPLDLDDVALFMRVKTLGSLSVAARESAESVSQVSRALARLERRVGARLMHRGTHGLSLTDEGDTFARYATVLLETQGELAAALSGTPAEPSGWVRASVSPVLAQTLIVPSLPALQERYPRIALDICAEDRVVDMAREGIDVALRTGTPHLDTLVARQIGSFGRLICAAPDYLARRGEPKTVDALRDHHLLTSSTSPAINRWPLRPAPGRRSRRDAAPDVFVARGQTRTDNSAVLLSLALAGVGIGRFTDLAVRPLITEGRLVPILQDLFDTGAVPIYAVMPPERARLPKIAACIGHWRGWLAGDGRPPG